MWCCIFSPRPPAGSETSGTECSALHQNFARSGTQQALHLKPVHDHGLLFRWIALRRDEQKKQRREAIARQRNERRTPREPCDMNELERYLFDLQGFLVVED